MSEGEWVKILAGAGLGMFATVWAMTRSFISSSTCVAIRGDCSKLLAANAKADDIKHQAIDAKLTEIHGMVKEIHRDFYKPTVPRRDGE